MKRLTKLLYLALFAVVALNGFVISYAFANEDVIRSGKIICYLSQDYGSMTFTKCMNCVETVGTPVGPESDCGVN